MTRTKPGTKTVRLLLSSSENDTKKRSHVQVQMQKLSLFLGNRILGVVRIGNEFRILSGRAATVKA